MGTKRERRRRLRAVVDAMGRARRRPMDQTTTSHLWHELETGSWSVVDQIDRDRHRYLLARENAPDVLDARAITTRESQVMAYASRGYSNKLIAYELGLAPSTVATHLSNAATKLGLQSRAVLIQTYAALAGRAAPTEVSVSYVLQAGERLAVVALPLLPPMPPILSQAQREVVALVFAGKSNEAIARIRGVSIRTVDNQIASALKKLKVGSRAALIAYLMSDIR